MVLTFEDIFGAEILMEGHKDFPRYGSFKTNTSGSERTVKIDVSIGQDPKTGEYGMVVRE
ncbi:hypothetical protein GOV13_05240 [Candidatus Pacearchaeota archaeon]|nr:hypothetical protein [Candidatus Pacearchaeota archaeon]